MHAKPVLTNRKCALEPPTRRVIHQLERGVTLIEVMLVVAIVAMVAAAASISGIKVFGGSQKKAAQSDMRTVRGAIKTWWLSEDATVCPSLELLVRDGLLDKDGRRSDPWGMPFKIECGDQDVTVRSAGPDRRFDTEDDLRVPQGT